MEKGFTLVELSIVLVIIGMLVGGILVGQSLIESTKMQSSIREIQQYDIAVQNFLTKYKSLPGDTKKLTPPGDGDGGVFSNSHIFQMLAANSELFLFWRHLNQVGVLKQPFKTYTGGAMFDGNFAGLVPKLKIGKDCYITAHTNIFWAGFDSPGDRYLGEMWSIANGSVESQKPCLTAVDAMALDTKLDDGVPSTGDVQQQYPYSGPRINGYLGCDPNTETKYDVAGIWNASNGSPESSPNTERIECLLGVKAKWYR